MKTSFNLTSTLFPVIFLLCFSCRNRRTEENMCEFDIFDTLGQAEIPIKQLHDNMPNAMDTQPDPFMDKECILVAERSPEFPGGSKLLARFIRKHTKLPELAHKNGVTGRVFVSFIVSEKGELSDIFVLKGIGFGCDEEAMKVVRSMPRWKPAEMHDKAVRCKFVLPIFFGARSK